MKLYHGSLANNIKKFNLDNPRFDRPIEGFGIYLTPEYEIARGYAGESGSVRQLVKL